VAELATKQVTGYYGQLRWLMPDGAAVEPPVFMPIAEGGGLVPELDFAAVERAVAVVAARPDVEFVAVTVSVSSLDTPTFVAVVLRCLEQAGAEPSSLRLVIDEPDVRRLTDAGRAALADLAAVGVPLWVGDIGSARVSVPELVELGVEGIALDAALLARLGAAEGATDALVAGFGALVKALGLRGAAVGVQHQRTVSALRRQGWEFGIGPLFGPARPAAALLAAHSG
jgi:EAL domain-containing protein (putative c-di-GMP-specific phosphodiesterase class I)